MSIAPELGTRPRPDSTGVARYDGAATPPDIRHIGATRAVLADLTPSNFSVPWGAIRVDFDFPETKYGATAYEIEVSSHADFQRDLPEVERNQTGISGNPAAGVFEQVNIVAINAYSGVNRALQPDTQYYLRVRAVLAVGNSEWSEPMGLSTAVLPWGSEDPALAPAVSVSAAYVGGNDFITPTVTATPNAITASPIYDYRTYWKSDTYGGPVFVSAGNGDPLQVLGDGLYTVYTHVTDEAGNTTVAKTTVLVDGFPAP